jgi:hypothetical protein
MTVVSEHHPIPRRSMGYRLRASVWRSGDRRDNVEGFSYPPGPRNSSHAGPHHRHQPRASAGLSERRSIPRARDPGRPDTRCSVIHALDLRRDGEANTDNGAARHYHAGQPAACLDQGASELALGAAWVHGVAYSRRSVPSSSVRASPVPAAGDHRGSEV